MVISIYNKHRMKPIENLKSKLNLFTLNFHNAKCGKDYNKQSYPFIKKVNLHLSGWSFIFSLGLLLWIILIFDSVNYDLENLNLSIRKIQTQDKEFFRNLTIVYYDRFIFTQNEVNVTKNENFLETENKYFYSNDLIIDKDSIKNFIDLSVDKNYSFLMRKFLFTRQTLPLIIVLCTLNFVLFLASFLTPKFPKIYFSFIFFLFGLNFHLLSGILRSFLSFSSDSILCLVVLQLFLKLIIVTKAKFKWLCIMIISFFTLVSEFIMMYLFHFKIPETLTYYLIANDLINVLTIIICYISELNSKINFILLRQSEFEREYLSNLIFNLEEGFFSYNKGNISMINRSMQKIVDNYEKILNLKTETEISNNEKLFALNSPENYEMSNADLFENFKQNIFSAERNRFVNASRIIIENFLENLTDLNMDLPIEIINLIIGCNESREAGQDGIGKHEKFDNSGNIHLIQNLDSKYCISNFSLEKFTEKVKEYLHNLNLKNSKSNFKDSTHGNFSEKGFLNFIILGNIEMKNIFYTNLNSSSKEDTTRLSLSNKKYQVSFRLIDHEEERGLYLEMMFNDVSKATQLEREKTVDNCRSLYLSKVAHELKNPLTSLVELQEGIKDTLAIDRKSPSQILKKSNSIIFNKVLSLADHSKLICRIMEMFLKDFYVFANLKESCLNECDQGANCIYCKQQKVCTKCNVCNNCEESKFTYFNYNGLVSSCLESFRQLSIFEEKNIKFEQLHFDKKHQTNCNSNVDNELNKGIYVNNCEGKTLCFNNYNNNLICRNYMLSHNPYSHNNKIKDIKYHNMNNINKNCITLSSAPNTSRNKDNRHEMKYLDNIDNKDKYKRNCNHMVDQDNPHNKINLFSPEMKFGAGNKRKNNNLTKFTHVNNINNLNIKKDFNNLIFSDADTCHKYPNYNSINCIKPLSHSTETFMIRTDQEILRSIIFNIIYHSYKNTFEGEIKITSEFLSTNSLLLCFYDTGLEIDPQFIKSLVNENQKLFLENNSNNNIFIRKNSVYSRKLNNMKIQENNFAFPITSTHFSQPPIKKLFTRDLSQITGDKFNKYFGIFIAHNLVKKLGSNLKIESSESGNKYSFVLNLKTQNSMCFTDRPHQTYQSTILQSSIPVPKCNIIANKTNNQNFNLDSNFSKQTEVNNFPFDLNKLNLDFLSSFHLGNSNDSFTTSNRLDTDSKLGSDLSNIIYDENLGNILKIFNSSPNTKSFSQKNNTISDIEQHSKTKKILIVDDEKLVRGTLKRYFKRLTQQNEHQYEVIEAENALEALNFIHESFISKNLFDVIISDEYMPFMKGSYFIKIIRHIYNDSSFLSKRINIISHTAFDTPEIKAILRENGADCIWNKPIAYEEFKNYFVN